MTGAGADTWRSVLLDAQQDLGPYYCEGLPTADRERLRRARSATRRSSSSSRPRDAPLATRLRNEGLLTGDFDLAGFCVERIRQLLG